VVIAVVNRSINARQRGDVAVVDGMSSAATAGCVNNSAANTAVSTPMRLARCFSQRHRRATAAGA
jgi:hypothetical protein